VAPPCLTRRIHRDLVSEGIRHGVLRLAPKKDEEIRDIATGTGLTARNISRTGAKVTGVDIAQGLLEAARQLSEEEGLSIEWRLADAERLPFADASFDAAASTFGIMFAVNQEAADKIVSPKSGSVLLSAMVLI
jgi:ubiquinone/menaquinone biosynthesis C-methylase UbiE